jgi:hypothetical protein
MTLSVTPTLPVIAAQGATTASTATGGTVFLPGTVVNAAVLQTAENLVQIAIANLAMDVMTEVPLTAGQTLQLAVSQNPDGSVRLTIVGQGAGTAAGAAGTAPDYVSLSPNAQANAELGATSLVQPAASPFQDPLTPLQRMAVDMASETAATRQQSLSTLFANLTAAAASNSLPPALQDAVTQVLAQQASLESGLSGTDIQAAFQQSGLFLEASLAAPHGPAEGGGVPDLKAALIVLRQALASVVETASPLETAAAASSASAGPQTVATKYTAGNVASPPMAPWLTPEADGAPQRARVPLQLGLPEGAAMGTPQSVLSEALLGLEPGSATSATVLNLLQEALQGAPRAGGGQTTIVLPDGRSEDVTLRTLTPPPPIRGAWPAAQPVSAATIAPGAPLATVAHRLLEDTDAALARQTLLQVASLPQAPNQTTDANGNRLDPGMPRWNFEIPFATPQGTAMAQFEISRDGGGNSEAEAAKRMWRARFTLDLEPAGPVHALVTFSGERTSVRMWAERPQTAARLRAGAFELSQALSRAELVPGDIVIREGTPPQAAPARAGYFLDRAL